MIAVSTSTYVPSTKQRVRNTDASINRRIDDQLENAIRYYSVHLEDIDSRLKELDEEWDVERMIEANASTLALAGTVLGITVDKRFLALPMITTAFLLQHAIQGWCPPIPILRRLGFRTADEINRERYALKAPARGLSQASEMGRRSSQSLALRSRLSAAEARSGRAGPSYK
jgi:hypothetical protein